MWLFRWVAIYPITGQNENAWEGVNQSAARIQMVSHGGAQEGWHIIGPSLSYTIQEFLTWSELNNPDFDGFFRHGREYIGTGGGAPTRHFHSRKFDLRTSLWLAVAQTERNFSTTVALENACICRANSGSKMIIDSCRRGPGRKKWKLQLKSDPCRTISATSWNSTIRIMLKWNFIQNLISEFFEKKSVQVWNFN